MLSGKFRLFGLLALLVVAPSIFAAERPSSPSSVEDLITYLNACIENQDWDCMMSAVYTKGTDPAPIGEFASTWKECFPPRGEMIAFPSEGEELELTYEKDRFDWSLSREPVGFVGLSCKVSSGKTAWAMGGPYYVGSDSGLYYILLWEPSPLAIDSAVIRSLAVHEADDGWSDVSSLVELVEDEFPGHEQDEYRREISEVLLDLLGRDQILLYKIYGWWFPDQLGIKDGPVSLDDADDLFERPVAWLPAVDVDESGDSWSLWYRFTPEGLEAVLGESR